MKNLFILCLLISIIIEISSVVNFKEYKSEEKDITSNTLKDLLDIDLICPNKGALKNFAIRTNSGKIYYDFGCYSSLTSSSENDESILKDLYFSNTVTIKSKVTDSIETLGKVDVICPVDYALSQFTITKNENDYIQVEYGCVGVKSSSQTKLNTISSSSTVQGSYNTLESLSGLTCGDNTIETDEVPGTPLKGFKFNIVISGNSAKSSFFYSFHKLRSIENEKKAWASKTKQLRDNNTQKN